MFEALAERLLNSILGEYIENFSAENLKIGIWSGQVVLRNVVLKKSIIRKLNLPFKINYSRLGCLKMNIPWKSLASSKIEVLLEGFEIVLAEVPVAEWKCKNTQIIEKRKKEMENFCESVVSDFAKKGEKTKESQDGFFSKLVVKIIDNLQVTIKDIHIRYQDQITNAYSFGVTLEEFKLYTVNASGQPQYVDRSKPENAKEPLRKRLELYNIGIYWNEKSEFYSEDNYQAKMSSSIAKRGQPALLHNYVILMSSQAQLLQREAGKQFKEPEIDLQIGLKTLRLEITNTQLQQIITLAQRLQRYTRKVIEQNRQQLSPKEVKANEDFFNKIFPQYYNGFGSNLSKNDQQRLQQILEKMQVDNFTKYMTPYLQEKEKERIIKEKQEKKKSWWFGKPKQLTKEELQEIQAYLNDNFGQEVAVVKRPEDYHYIKVGFKLERLEVVVANRLAIMKEGIEASFDDLQIKFGLRDGGYIIQITLQDIGIDMFKQIGVDAKESKQVLSKLNEYTSKMDNSYLKMVVVGNPLSKKYLNTEIKLSTSELLIVFDPKIISIATEFADLKLSQENKEAALEKFGEIKEKTETAVTETIDKPVKAQIGVDVIFNSVTVVVPFSPHRQAHDCWALNLGVTHLTTDQETLKRLQTNENQPLDTFNLQLTDFSFRHFRSISQLKQTMAKQITSSITHSVIDNLSFRLRVDVFNKATENLAKIKILAVLPSLSVNLNQFTYSSLLRLGDAFEQEEKVQQSRVTVRIDEKKEIQQKAAKIGFVSIKDSLTLAWKKYVAIMSQNYIYLYLNKNDKDYYAFYYVKGATLIKYKEPTDKEKPYHFRIKNKVNEVVFGFDKEEQIDDWITKIKATSKEQELVSQVVNTTAVNALSGLLKIVPKKQHNKLNLFIQAQIESIGIKVYTTQSLLDKVVKLYFTKLSTKIYLHQSKKRISLELVSLELLDTIQHYKSKELIYFLQTKRSKEDENLITLQIQQLNRDHPLYDHTDSAITISFGSLLCNYKCETVKMLMAFFIPPPTEDKKPPSAILESDVLVSTSFALPIAEQIFSLKLKLKINEISMTLVNEKVKSVIGKMGITNLQLFMGISQRRMLLVGSLKDLYLIDKTNYPQTIHQQQQFYGQQRMLLTASIGEDKNMMDFNIEMLNEVNEYNKKMLINIKIANLTTFYLQQPILRLITYLNTQMLPSFKTAPKEETVVLNDTKPEPTTMQLKVELTNISVFVETQYQPVDRQKQEFMQLNIAKVTVKNDSMYKPYVKQNKPIVLVENYEVRLEAMTISVHYSDINRKEHRYKLTNNLDFTVSTYLIANPEFYKKEIPEMFLNGLRVECSMTPFFMRMNHDDYNFIMKCLNWGITHDDGLESVLFDIPINATQLKDQEAVSAKDPFYLVVNMDCISLFVTQNDIPIAFLLLDQMVFTFVSSEIGMQMDLAMKNLYGTSIEYNSDEKILIERGIFNSLGYSSQNTLEKALDLQGFIDLFDRRGKVSNIQKPNFLKCIITISQDSTDIQLQMHELVIDADVRLLMILSTLANTDEKYIKGPQPIIKKVLIDQTDAKKQKTSKKFTMLLDMKKLLCSVSDLRKEKFAIIEGGVALTMINYGDKSIEEIEERIRRKPVNDGINHSTIEAALRNFTVYFSKIKEGNIIAKREFLRPMHINLNLQKFYFKNRDIYILSTDIRLKTDELVLAASLKDILNVNNILQDNLKVLAEFQNEEKTEVAVEEKDLHLQIKRLEENIAREIQSKTKIVGTIAPMQIEIINDCDNNFMPVLRLLIQDTSPAMHQTVISTQIFVVPILSLYFFNPRSSRWQPIIEPFKAAVNYKAITINKQQNTTINVTTNNLEQATSSLKINVSTQMISTLIATRDIIKAERENIDRNIQVKEIEISPYIFHNITNEKIYLLRGDSEFELNPLFKGPIKLLKDKEIVFKIRNTSHKFSLDHYGVLRIPQTDYYIRFATQKLNRIIKFMSLLIIKNKLQQPIYVRRFGKVSEVPIKVEKDDVLPLDGVESFAVSLNGSSYTEKTRSDSVKLTDFLLAEKKNFVVLLKCREKINRYTFIHLLSPFVIYNCLPKDINLQFIQKAKTKSTVTVPAQRSYSVFTSQDITTIQIKAYTNGYTWSTRFRYNPENQSECHLQLEDEDNFKTILNYIFKKDKSTNQFILIVYCKKIIVNQTHDKLLVYANFEADERKKKIERFELLGGQKKDDDAFDDKVIMVGEEVGNHLRVCGAHSIFDFATPISTAGLGTSQARIVVDREYQGRQQSLFMTIGVEISAIKMTKECDIFCKKIVLKSRAIIANNSKLDLTLMENQATKYRFSSEAGTRKNFVSGLPGIEGKHYRYLVTAKGFLPSKLINLPAQGSVFFKLKSADKLDKNGKWIEIYFKIYVQEVDSYNFYEIHQIFAQELPYQVRVGSQKLRVTIPALNLHASKGEVSRFLNESESEDKFQVDLVIQHSESKEEVRMRVCPDDLKFKQKELIRIEKGGMLGSVAVVVEVTITDKQRTILVKELAREEEEKEIQQSAMMIDLKEIIISINQNSQSIEVPYESFVVTLQRLYFIKLETDKKQQYQLKLGFLQIDQGFPFLISSPVILTPYKYELFTKEKDPKSIFNFTIVFSKQFVKNTFISQVSVDFDDIVATFSADFITLVMAISAEFGEVINYKENTYLLDKQEERWQEMKLPAEGNNVFIRSIKLSPFVIDLSAELNIKKLNLQNNLLLTTIMSTFGIVISNIDNAPFEMSGIEINDCIDTVPSITAKLIAHYKRTCINQLYKVFGSLNILGNPLNLFRNISTGVKDLKEKPAQGFVNGPAEFGLGIVEGTGSFVAHSVGGAFNSISKVTGTVSSGLATLAFDKQFEDHREKERMKKPQNVIQGLEKGGKAIFYGFKEGITGVWMQPIENARKEGALGFVKGAAKGLAGLVIKPVTGIIDFASKTTEGIKNNALIFEDKARESRMRYPRVFYTECLILKEYNARDSQLFSILKKMDNEDKFQNAIFIDAFEAVDGHDYLVILQTGIVYIDLSARKLRWSVEFGDLQLEDNKERKMLQFKKRGKAANFFNVDYQVEIEQDEIRAIVAELILTLQKERQQL